jgi:hypothetical protein
LSLEFVSDFEFNELTGVFQVGQILWEFPDEFAAPLRKSFSAVFKIIVCAHDSSTKSQIRNHKQIQKLK